MWSLGTYNCHEVHHITDFFDDEQFGVLQETLDALSIEEAKVGYQDDSQVNTTIRSSKVSWLTPHNNEWLYEHVTNHINEVNYLYYKYDLTHFYDMQYTVYESTTSDFFSPHVDYHPMGNSMNFRKLSFSILLNDDYEGGDLVMHTTGGEVVVEKQKNSIVFFPSFVLHGVTPVTKGTRKSLVGWVCGPVFK